MTQPCVICVGELLFDYLADQLGRSLADVASWTAFPGGAPANVACALARLGLPSAWVGCVGDDDAGRTLLDVLRARDVDVSGAVCHATAPTRQVFVNRTRSGERMFAGFGTCSTTDFADAYLDATMLPERLFERATWVVMGTLGLAYPHSRAALERSLEWAERYQLRIAIDLNWRPVFWPQPDIAPATISAVLQRADYLKCSDEEARWLFQTDEPETIAAHLPRARGIAVTAGERGCRYLLDSQSGSVPAFPVRAIDTTGAGDSFLAGWLYAMTTFGLDATPVSAELAERLFRFASAAGALTIAKPGAIAAQPTLNAIQTLLATT